MKRTHLFHLTGVALLTAGVYGCTTDKAYDQLTEDGGIDMTINVAPNGLTIPLGSIDRIMLSEIMDTAATNILKVDEINNRFYIEETGSLDTTSFFVEKLKFGYTPSIEPQEFALDVIYNWDAFTQMVIDNTPADTPLGDLFTDSRIVVATRERMDLGNSDADLFNFTLHNENTDPAIVSISSIALSQASDMKLKLNISQLPGELQEYDFVVDSLRLEVPDYLVVADKQGKSFEKDPETGKYIIPGSNAHKEKNTTEAVWDMAVVKFNGIDFGDDKLINNEGVIDRSGEIKIGGKFLIRNLSVEARDLKVVGKQEGALHQTVELINPIKVAPVVTVDSIEISSLTGIFDPKVEDMSIVTELELDDKLDFLTDDRTSFDPLEVSVGVDLTYHCPVTATAWAELANDKEEHATVENIQIYEPEGGEPLHLMISTNDPAGQKDHYQFPNVKEIFSPVPEKIFINMGFKANREEAVFKLGERYKVYADYNVYVPMQFNSINSTYEEVIENIFDDDIKDYINDIHEMVLDLTVVSTLGIEARFEVAGRNMDGKIQKDLIVCEPSGIIKRGTLESPSTSTISIRISAKDLSLVKDLVLQICVEGNDCVLMPDQYLEIPEMKLSIKNQNIDLNDKD